jgi:hypothetical protein
MRKLLRPVKDPRSCGTKVHAGEDSPGRWLASTRKKEPPASCGFELKNSSGNEKRPAVAPASSLCLRSPRAVSAPPTIREHTRVTSPADWFLAVGAADRVNQVPWFDWESIGAEPGRL